MPTYRQSDGSSDKKTKQNSVPVRTDRHLRAQLRQGDSEGKRILQGGLQIFCRPTRAHGNIISGFAVIFDKIDQPVWQNHRKRHYSHKRQKAVRQSVYVCRALRRFWADIYIFGKIGKRFSCAANPVCNINVDKLANIAPDTSEVSG